MKQWYDCTKEEKIKRWEQAYRVLSEMPPHARRKHFNMQQWGVKTECGTVACAAGQCGMDRWFRRRGLRLIPSEVTKETITNLIDEGFINFKDSISSQIQKIASTSDYFNAEGSFEDENGNEVDVADFFGEKGSENIFFNPAIRPVSKVMKEIKDYLNQLKSPYYEEESF